MDPRLDRRCSVREISRAPLILPDTQQLYIEPISFTRSGGRFLLAGSPSYAYRRPARGALVPSPNPSPFGVILEQGRSTRRVESPLRAGVPTEGVRALPRPGGGWSIAFAEMVHTGRPFGDSAAALWFGLHDGREWRSLERLPALAPGKIDSFLASDLVTRGDTILWSLRVLHPDGHTDVALYRRNAGKWRYDLLPAVPASYVQFAASPDALAVVGVEPGLRYDQNSLLLYTRSSPWRFLRRLVHGGDEPVHAPSFRQSALGPVITWTVQRSAARGGGAAARAMIGGAGTSARTLELGRDLDQVQFVRTPDGPPEWVLDHVDSAGARELRFVRADTGGVWLAGAIPDPYAGFFAAVHSDPSTILLAGPVAPKSAGGMPTTLFLRVRVSCERHRNR